MDNLEQLLSQLREAGPVDSEGSFSLDPRRAREILQQYRFPDPGHYVLPLYQAALAWGAPQLQVETRPGSCLFRFAAPPLSEADLQGLVSALLVNPGGARERQRLLALGVFTALSGPSTRVELRSGTLRSLWTREDHRLEAGPRSPELVVQVSSGSSGEQEAGLLQRRCALGATEVMLNGVSLPLPSLPGALWRHLCSPNPLDSLPRARMGVPAMGQEMVSAGPFEALLTLSPESEAAVTLVVGGLTALEPFPAPEGVAGIVSSQRLSWDLGLQKPVQDQAWEQLRSALQEQQLGLACQAASLYPRLEGTPKAQEVREVIFDQIRRSRRDRPQELWEAGLFLQVGGDPLSMAELARRSPVRHTRRFWEFSQPTGVVQLRSRREHNLLSSFFTLEEADPIFEQLARARELEAAWRLRLPMAPRLSQVCDTPLLARVPLAGVSGEVGLHTGEARLYLFKNDRLMMEGACSELWPGIVAVAAHERLTPEPSWAWVRSDQAYQEVLEAVRGALPALFRRAPEKPSGEFEEILRSWLRFWCDQPVRPADWDDTPVAHWPLLRIRGGSWISWARLKALEASWYLLETASPSLPTVPGTVLLVDAELAQLLAMLLPYPLQNLQDLFGPGDAPRKPTLPAGRPLAWAKLLRGELSIPTEPSGLLGPPGLDLRVVRYDGQQASLKLPIGYGPIAADIESGATIRAGLVVQDEIFHSELAAVLERCRGLCQQLTSRIRSFSEDQWPSVRLYLLRQLVHESLDPRPDAVWEALTRAPLFPTTEGQNLSWQDLTRMEGPPGYVSQQVYGLSGVVLVLAGESLELSRRALGGRLQDRQADLERSLRSQDEVVATLTLPEGDTLLQRFVQPEGRLGVLSDPLASSRVLVCQARRRRALLERRLPIPIVAVVDSDEPLEELLERLQEQARGLLDELAQRGHTEYLVGLALGSHDPQLRALPVVPGLLRPLSVQELTLQAGARGLEFLTGRAADRVYELPPDLIDPFLALLPQPNLPLLTPVLQELLPWPLVDRSLRVEVLRRGLEGQQLPDLDLEAYWPGRRWLVRAPLVGARLLGEVGLPEDWASCPAETLWHLPSGQTSLGGLPGLGLVAVLWADRDLERSRLQEALPSVAQTLFRQAMTRLDPSAEEVVAALVRWHQMGQKLGQSPVLTGEEPLVAVQGVGNVGLHWLAEEVGRAGCLRWAPEEGPDDGPVLTLKEGSSLVDSLGLLFPLLRTRR